MYHVHFHADKFSCLWRSLSKAQPTADTAAPRFLSTTAVSQAPISTRDASQSCRRQSDPENARWSSKRWADVRSSGGETERSRFNQRVTHFQRERRFDRDWMREEVKGCRARQWCLVNHLQFPSSAFILMWGPVSQVCLHIHTVRKESLNFSRDCWCVCTCTFCVSSYSFVRLPDLCDLHLSFWFCLAPSSCSCSEHILFLRTVQLNQECFFLSFLFSSDFCFCPQLLSMLINAAYKPGRVLKELQELQEQSWECQEETLKAKWGDQNAKKVQWRVQNNGPEHNHFIFFCLCGFFCEALKFNSLLAFMQSVV